MEGSKERKGDGYAAILIECCKARTDLPATVVKFLEDINKAMRPPEKEETEPQPAPGTEQGNKP